MSSRFLRVYDLACLVFGATLVSCGGGGGGDSAKSPSSPSAPSPPAVLTTVAVSLASPAIQVGQTTTASAVGADQNGAAIATGSVTWTSSASAVATVSASGVVSGVGAGQASIIGSAGGKSGQASITVSPIAVAIVAVTPTGLTLAIGSTQQLTASLKDANGNALTGRTLTWASSNTAIATVSATGLVTGLAAGKATITATSEGKTGSSDITFAVGPAIASVGPATITPGGSATIVGTNFSATPAQNVVRIGGAQATITSASTTQLTATVPCTASGSVVVQVTTIGVASGAVNVPLAGTVRTLAVGDAVVSTSAASTSCNELPASGTAVRYVVAVFNAATNPNSVTDVEFGGNPAIGAVSSVVRSRRTPSSNLASSKDDANGSVAHVERLRRERESFERDRPSMSLSVSGSGRDAHATAPVAVGDRRVFYYAFLHSDCPDTTKRITARVLYAGTRAIVWEDTSNAITAASNATLAARYQKVGQLFDQEQYDLVRSTFGDPLRRDADLDGDSRVGLIFTRRTNESGGNNFVRIDDQYPRTTCASSNVGEFAYFVVPTDTTASTLALLASPTTVIHEVKHIASFSARIASGTTLEESWLEEGTARIAEEIWTRSAVHRTSAKGNAGYGNAVSNGVFCDVNRTNATCNANDQLRRPMTGVASHFQGMQSRLVAPWNWSPFGNATGQAGSVFYATAWSLARYAADRYGTSDATFFTNLVAGPAIGMTNLASVASVPADQLIGGWTLAWYADDYPGLTSASADIKFPTWNLRDIYTGLHNDPTQVPSFWPLPYPIQPAPLTFGAFTAQQTGIRGGGAAYFEISGTAAAAQVLNVRGLGGGAASPDLRIAIARLQ
jgi:hypothetical protein